MSEGMIVDSPLVEIDTPKVEAPVAASVDVLATLVTWFPWASVRVVVTIWVDTLPSRVVSVRVTGCVAGVVAEPPVEPPGTSDPGEESSGGVAGAIVKVVSENSPPS
jgi:hypothetical protein